MKEILLSSLGPPDNETKAKDCISVDQGGSYDFNITVERRPSSKMLSIHSRTRKKYNRIFTKCRCSPFVLCSISYGTRLEVFDCEGEVNFLVNKYEIGELWRGNYREILPTFISNLNRLNTLLNYFTYTQEHSYL